jgi:hypothetical protein
MTGSMPDILRGALGGYLNADHGMARKQEDPGL